MLIEDDIKNLLHRLSGGDSISVFLDGSEINIRFLDDASKVFLTTSVYSGGNYIPSSVRRCLSHKSPLLHTTLPTFLSVNEQEFKIYLNHVGQAQHLTYELLKNLIEEFNSLAEQWRLYFDEHDKNDLIYVRVK